MKRELRPFYGHAWRTKTRPRILARAGYECERCAAPDRPMGLKSVLEIAHLDGEPRGNEADEELACLCHRCHRQHDYALWAAQFRAWLIRRREERIDAADAARPILALLKEAV